MLPGLNILLHFRILMSHGARKGIPKFSKCMRVNEGKAAIKSIKSTVAPSRPATSQKKIQKIAQRDGNTNHI
jgi:hypothetical protein